MRRFVQVATCLVSLVIVDSAQAQLVRVGPFGGVNISVPFVSVDVLPFGGGTRVRAPFTSVDTRLYAYAPYFGRPAFYGSGYYGHYHYPPIYPEPIHPAPGYGWNVPAYPPPAYLHPAYPHPEYLQPEYPQYSDHDPAYAAQAGSESSVEQLRMSAMQLSHSFSTRRDDADIWLDYLRPEEIIATIDRGDSLRSLSELLKNYDGVAGNSELTSIWSIDGFWQTHRLLRELIQSSRSVPANPSAPGEPTLAEPLPAESSAKEPVPPATGEKEAMPVPAPVAEETSLL